MYWYQRGPEGHMSVIHLGGRGGGVPSIILLVLLSAQVTTLGSSATVVSVELMLTVSREAD